MSDRHADDEPIDRDPEIGADRTDPDTEDVHDPNPTEEGKWVSAIIALLGAWMIVQAILVDLVAAQFWNDVVVGALLVAVGAYNYSRRADERLGSLGAAALAALLGLWLVASPFMFGADAGTTEAVNEMGFWNDIVIGLIALALGAYSAYEIRDHRSDTGRPAG